MSESMMTEKLPFFLCATPRVGYHLLVSLLHSTNVIEPIIGQAITGTGDEKKIESNEGWLSYWQGISERHGIDTTKIWGTKFYTPDDAEHYLSVKGVSPSSIKWIWMRRRDKIRQAISLLAATKSGVWFFNRKVEGYLVDVISDLDISVESVNAEALLMYQSDFRWGEFFRKNKIEPHILFYENFQHEISWKPTVLSVLEFLEGFPREDIDVHTNFLKTPLNEKIYEAVIEANRKSLRDG